MSADRTSSPAPSEVVVPPPKPPRRATMLFKIVAPHEHRAVLGTRVFWCKRETTTTDGRLSIRWLALEGNTLLQGDCRTLNEAKQRCRAAASADDRRSE